jgi:hypothetical protein
MAIKTNTWQGHIVSILLFQVAAVNESSHGITDADADVISPKLIVRT